MLIVGGSDNCPTQESVVMYSTLLSYWAVAWRKSPPGRPHYLAPMQVPRETRSAASSADVVREATPQEAFRQGGGEACHPQVSDLSQPSDLPEASAWQRGDSPSGTLNADLSAPSHSPTCPHSSTVFYSRLHAEELLSLGPSAGVLPPQGLPQRPAEETLLDIVSAALMSSGKWTHGMIPMWA